MASFLCASLAKGKWVRFQIPAFQYGFRTDYQQRKNLKEFATCWSLHIVVCMTVFTCRSWTCQVKICRNKQVSVKPQHSAFRSQDYIQLSAVRLLDILPSISAVYLLSAEGLLNILPSISAGLMDRCIISDKQQGACWIYFQVYQQYICYQQEGCLICFQGLMGRFIRSNKQTSECRWTDFWLLTNGFLRAGKQTYVKISEV